MPNPPRDQAEEYIRSFKPDANLSRYNDRSLFRLYNYAREASFRGEEFDLQRGVGHPPAIQHHDYETKKMRRLPAHKEQIFRIPMLDDWYVGSCERPPILADVYRLLGHDGNFQANHLYLAFTGIVRNVHTGEITSDSTAAVSVARVAVIKVLREIEDDIGGIVRDAKGKPKKGQPKINRLIKDPMLEFLERVTGKKWAASVEYLKVCIISMRPAITQRGATRLVPQPPPEPEVKIKRLTPKQREEVIKKHRPKPAPKPKVKGLTPEQKKALGKQLKKKRGKGI